MGRQVGRRCHAGFRSRRSLSRGAVGKRAGSRTREEISLQKQKKKMNWRPKSAVAMSERRLSSQRDARCSSGPPATNAAAATVAFSQALSSFLAPPTARRTLASQSAPTRAALVSDAARSARLQMNAESDSTQPEGIPESPPLGSFGEPLPIDYNAQWGPIDEETRAAFFADNKNYPPVFKKGVGMMPFVPKELVKRRDDIKKILLIGAGPIIIGQACEFDYSGTQACKALRDEGFQVVLVNSNPATIMTDPETSDRTYIEPLTVPVIERIIEIEKPDAVLPTMGGQTALNLARSLAVEGILDKHGVELIGARLDAIEKGEDRLLFRDAMEKIGVACCPSEIANTFEEAKVAGAKIASFPLIIRPAYTLGGYGGGISYNQEEFERMAQEGLDASPVSQILVEQSLLGWKEYELEVMRDGADNVVIVCSIENLDPMGVHTGDSITVAPTQTLTDKEYQRLRDQSIAIIREIGVDTGGSNIQFSINPENGDVIVIEMNPRVSRSSALASKATGFPIAKLAAKLSVGESLPQITNDITVKTPAAFEPTLDYVVTKVPRFAFEKFAGADNTLNTQMRSVGEAMAIGRTFRESFQKALRSLEIGRNGWGFDGKDTTYATRVDLETALRVPTPSRIFSVVEAFETGMTIEEIYAISAYDKWFLSQMESIYLAAKDVRENFKLESMSGQDWFTFKSMGFSDCQLAHLLKSDETTVRQLRKAKGVRPVYKTVDTCAAEFEAYTPYMYSSYESCMSWGDDDVMGPECFESEVPPPTGKTKIVILGGGPNRIGQGIEFDYCCVHACFALRDAGYETVMVNSNPETVSTDYDTSDRLYFDPLTLEDVIAILEAEKPDGIIVQFGGQTPLKLAVPLENYLASAEAKDAGVTTKIWGTPPDSIDAAEDRDRFAEILRELGIRQPANGIVSSLEEAQSAAAKIGYPVVVRPSYVLGGRGMEIVYNDAELSTYMTGEVVVESEHPVLIDRFLSNATEVDVDAIADSEGNVVIGGIMEHIEQAGIHSGDSACSLPTVSVPYNALVTIRRWTVALAKRLNVVGLMNIQWAVQGEDVYILEANPRASRTVPFVSKAIGMPLAKKASLVMSGKTLAEVEVDTEILPKHVSVKEAVLPFNKFPGADILLSPEMRSTGEVMGIATTFGAAFAKAEEAAGYPLPKSGKVFISVANADKGAAVALAQDLVDLGFDVVATRGTYAALVQAGMNPPSISLALKLHEGRPNIIDQIKNGDIQLFISTASSRAEVGEANALLEDARLVRRAALATKMPVLTTIAAARAVAQGIRGMQTDTGIEVKAMQDYHPQYTAAAVAAGSN